MSDRLFEVEPVELATVIVFPNRVQPDLAQCRECERIYDPADWRIHCPHCEAPL